LDFLKDVFLKFLQKTYKEKSMNPMGGAKFFTPGLLFEQTW
jgi:hypothetical protein